MGTLFKFIIGLVVIGGVGLLLWWSGWLSSLLPMKAPVAAPTATSTEPVAQTEQPAITDMSMPSNLFDDAIAQDVRVIDAQTEALAGDLKNVDASLSDAPITQSY